MAYNEQMANRVTEMLFLTDIKLEEKKMFGGLCFMVNDKMCIGVKEHTIMVRTNPAMFDIVMEKEGCTPMIHSGKVLKGFVFVNIDTLHTKKNLAYWIDAAMEYNAIAKPTKKKNR